MGTIDLVLAALAAGFAVWGASWRGAARRDGIRGSFAPVEGEGSRVGYSTGVDASGRVQVTATADGRRITLLMTPDQARALASKIETTAATTEIGR